jgi:hypothetical protein
MSAQKRQFIQHATKILRLYIYLLHRSVLLEYVALGTHFHTSKAVPLDAMEALGGEEV